MATADAIEAGEPESEMNHIAVETFLDTLAEVALSVARRAPKERQE